MRFIVLIVIIMFTCAGCSSVSLNKIEQQELTEYISYSNQLIQNMLSKDTNKRLRLQPYRTRYRLIQPVILKFKNNQ